MDYCAYFDLGDGHGERGPYSLRSATPDEYYCSDSFKRAVSQYRISMLADIEFLAAHASTTGRTIVRIIVDGELVFKGLLAPTDSWTSGGVAADGESDLSDLEFEVLDFSSWLERELTDDDDVAWEGNLVCSATEVLSITHKLLALCGITGSLFIPAVLEDTVLAAFAPESGTAIGEIIDSLLHQYGLVLRWVVDHFETAAWLIEAPTPAIIIDEGIVHAGLKTEKTGREADGVEVLWYLLKSKENCLLAKPLLSLDSDGSFESYPVQPGLLWPEEANVGEVWFDYDSTSLSKKVTADGLKTSENKDFTQVILTKNHYIDIQKAGGIVEAFLPVFKNKAARIAYRNPTGTPLNISYCLVYGDAIYRGGENAVCKNAVSSPKKTIRYTAEYLHEETKATRLACALADQLATGCWRSTFSSDVRIELGTVGNLSDPFSSFAGLVLIINRTRDMETGIYTYKAISIGPVTINATATYRSILSSSPETTSSQKDAATAASAAAVAQAAADVALQATNSRSLLDRYIEYRYRRSSVQPPTPEGSEPEGWSTAFPEGADLAWVSYASKKGDGNVLSEWSAPESHLGIRIVTIYRRSSAKPPAPASYLDPLWEAVPPVGSLPLWGSSSFGVFYEGAGSPVAPLPDELFVPDDDFLPFIEEWSDPYNLITWDESINGAYLGRYHSAHPLSRPGDWWLVFDTDDAPIKRGIWKNVAGVPVKVDGGANSDSKYISAAFMDIAWACDPQNSFGEFSDYGAITVIANLAANAAFINALFANTLTLSADGSISSANYNESGGIPMAGFKLTGSNGLLRAVSAILVNCMVTGLLSCSQFVAAGIAPGGNMLKSIGSEITANTDNPFYYRSIQICAAGTVRVSVEAKGFSADGATFEIYILAMADNAFTKVVNAAVLTDSANYSWQSFDIPVEEGDTIVIKVIKGRHYTGVGIIGYGDVPCSIRETRVGIDTLPGFLSWLGIKGDSTTQPGLIESNTTPVIPWR